MAREWPVFALLMTCCWMRPGTSETCSKAGSWRGRRRSSCVCANHGMNIATPPVGEGASRS
eukprot:1865111-Pyramimonas_sp.AAC.1